MDKGIIRIAKDLNNATHREYHLKNWNGGLYYWGSTDWDNYNNHTGPNDDNILHE